jgi:hypothetical protein
MRYVPISSDLFNAGASAKAAREAEFLAMLRRPDAPPLPDDAAPERRRLIGWLSLASKRLARGRAAARARRAAG